MKDRDKSEQASIEQLRHRVAELEKTLQQKEAETALLLQVAPFGIHECDTNGRITFVNPSHERVSGFSAKELQGTYIWDRIEPGPQKESLPAYLKQLVSNQPPPIPYAARNIRKNGERYDVRIDWNYKRNAEGQVTGFLCIVSDITEQRRAEEQLYHSERTLRALMDASPESIVLVDADKTILFANATVARRLGRTVDEIVGRTFYDLFLPELAAQRMKYLQEVIRTGKAIRYEDERSGYFFENALHPIVDEQGKVTAVAILAIDRTERKRAEDALKKAHDELEQRVKERTAELTAANEEQQAIYDGMSDGLLVADLETRQFVRANEAMCRLLGYSEEELLSMTVVDIHPPQAVPSVLERFRTQQEGQRLLTENRPILRKDGTVFFADISNTCISYHGRPCVIGLFRDISERKAVQEALRQSEEKHRVLLEASPDAVVMADLNGKVLFASRQTWSLLGVSESEELVGQSVFGYVIEEDRRRLADNISLLAETGVRRNTEYTALRKDGAMVPMEISSAANRDAKGQPIAVMAVIRDITERKRAEETLRQHYEELRAIYDGMTDGLIISDAETKCCLSANRAMSDMLGYTEEELRSLSPESVHPPELLPVLAEKYEQLARGITSQAEDIPFLRKDGRLIYVDVRMAPISYNGQRCMMGLFRDITERKHAEETLRKEHHTLKHMLQSSDHERQVIAYEIHDELAQQLAGAMMQFGTYSHQKTNNPPLAAKAFDAGMTMLQQGHFEARRLIAGVRPPILDESGVMAAIMHLVNEQRLRKEPKIEFHSRVSFDRLVPIVENAIYRIVQEGLTNACQHSKSEKVRVSVVQQDDRVQIVVRDWGVGFDKKSVQANRFGLEGIRQRVRLLGGKCHIQSKEGKGTRISIELSVLARE